MKMPASVLVHLQQTLPESFFLVFMRFYHSLEQFMQSQSGFKESASNNNKNEMSEYKAKNQTGD
jgi:hypothetical protein